MKLRLEPNWDADVFAVWPALVCLLLKCDDCAEIHGVVLELKWLIFSLALVWEFDAPTAD